jgi:four helix bundle protein
MSNEIRSYKDLIIWQKAIDLVVEIYETLKGFPREELYGLSDQIRRSAVSVPSNIAEGQSRQHTAEFRQFLYIALGSLAELDTQLIIAHRLGYIDSNISDLYITKIIELRKMISTLTSKLKN